MYNTVHNVRYRVFCVRYRVGVYGMHDIFSGSFLKILKTKHLEELKKFVWRIGFSVCTDKEHTSCLEGI